ncbi:SDR family NAD(P)-dependent oxidoreductase, partial [Nocardia abscessus]|uniref:SDR family NAD(P)-dependent oxidoreductase n=1 Tax=Nocardia abscessus TaxID=120957 RepID=UPI002454E5CB
GLSELFVRGVGVDWPVLLGAGSGLIDLPTYAFQRQRFWLESAGTHTDFSSVGMSGVAHPLLGAAVETASGELIVTGRLSLSGQRWLADHVVHGVVVVPATVWVDMAVCAGARAGCEVLDELVCEVPLVLAESQDVRVQVVVGAEDGAGLRSVAVYSRAEGSTGPWLRHASGAVRAGGWEPGMRWEIAPSPDAMSVELGGCYGVLAERGLLYGPTFRGLRRAWRDDSEVVAEVVVALEQAESERLGVHPALLDATLHALMVAGLVDAQTALLPFAWDGVRLGTVAGAGVLRVRIQRLDEAKVSVRVADQDGRPVAEIAGLSVRSMSAQQVSDLQDGVKDSLYRLDWVEIAETDSPRVSCAVLGPVAVLDTELEPYEDLDTVYAAVWDGVPPVVVVDTEAVIARVLETSGADGAGLAVALTARVLEMVREWLADERFAHSRLLLVTRGGSDGANPAAAALWGLVRSAQSEHPGRFCLLDTDAPISAESLSRAVASGETQLCLRDGVLRSPALVGIGSDTDSLVPPPHTHWRVDSSEHHTLEGLRIVETPAAAVPLAPGEIRVSMHAAGLNFRDVVMALGMVTQGNGVLGGEGAGIVLEVGPGVDDLVPGEAVMGLFPSAFGPVCTTLREHVYRIPASWALADAASVPIVFLTAYHSLVHLAGLQPGQRILIHSAAGGVGLAALQIAQHRQAEIFATASPSKWHVLREHGIPESHIASSRDLDFVEKFSEQTGDGMDVVLNSLANEFVDASLGLVRSTGTLIELGKTDIRSPHQIASSYPGVRYQPFDLSDVDPPSVQRELSEIVDLFDHHILHRAPVRHWPISSAREAFRSLGQGHNIGKYVLTLPPVLDPEGTVLVTGGLGGLGRVVVRHLAAAHRVRRVVLVSRQGIESGGAVEFVDELTGLGVEAHVVACDVADRQAVARVIASIPAQYPLRAVVHAAGVLDDGVIESMDHERLARVMGPKVLGAVNLHELTREHHLSAFVLFSSIAGTIGNPGQANYAAANAFLDALAQHRRDAGLPAVSLCWGLWEQRSAMTENLARSDRARITRAGVLSISSEQGLELFDAALASGRPVVYPARFDLSALRAQARTAAVSAVVRGLISGRGAEVVDAEVPVALEDRLSGLSDDQARTVLLDVVRANVATVLGHTDSARIEADRPFTELGFDSLTAIELRNKLSNETKLKIPA